MNRARSQTPTIEAARAALRDSEPDRYIATLLAPDRLSTDLLARWAFSAEISRVPLLVGEPMMGQIRLQWWHDAIDHAAGAIMTGHPVADLLLTTMRERGLDPAPLHAAIETRLFDLGRGVHPDDDALIKYLDAAEGGLFELALVVCGVPAGAARVEAGRAAGRAYGLTRRLCRLPELIDRGGFPIPLSRLRAKGIEPEALALRPVETNVRQAFATIVAEMQDVARASLDAARNGAQALGPQATLALLPLALVEPYLAVQFTNRGQALSRIAEVGPLARIWSLWRAARRGRI